MRRDGASFSLPFPADGFVDVARRVLGGAAGMADLGFEAVDDLQLALELVDSALLFRRARLVRRRCGVLQPVRYECPRGRDVAASRHAENEACPAEQATRLTALQALQRTQAIGGGTYSAARAANGPFGVLA